MPRQRQKPQERSDTDTRDAPVEITGDDIDSTFTVTGPDGDTHQVSVEGDPTSGELAALAATMSSVIDTPPLASESTEESDGGKEAGTDDPWRVAARHAMTGRGMGSGRDDAWKLSGRPGCCYTVGGNG